MRQLNVIDFTCDRCRRHDRLDKRSTMACMWSSMGHSMNPMEGEAPKARSLDLCPECTVEIQNWMDQLVPIPEVSDETEQDQAADGNSDVDWPDVGNRIEVVDPRAEAVDPAVELGG